MARPVLTAAILGASVWSAGAMAQPAAEALPFGLDHIRWQMTLAQASAQFSMLAPQMNAPDGSPVTNQLSSYFGPYRWHDCVFSSISLHFSKDQLDDIALDTGAVSSTCQSAMKEELTSHYGDGQKRDLRVLKTNVKFGEGVRWTGGETVAGYSGMDDGRFAEVGLSERDGPPLVIYDLAR